jgi:hypothetical protein
MKNSYTTLHRNLDNRILTLENETNPNQTLITDLKKQKLKLSDRMVSTVHEQLELFTVSEKVRAKKLVDSMIHDQKRSDKKRRKSRKKRIQSAIRRIDKGSLSG